MSVVDNGTQQIANMSDDLRSDAEHINIWMSIPENKERVTNRTMPEDTTADWAIPSQSKPDAFWFHFAGDPQTDKYLIGVDWSHRHIKTTVPSEGIQTRDVPFVVHDVQLTFNGKEIPHDGTLILTFGTETIVSALPTLIAQARLTDQKEWLKRHRNLKQIAVDMRDMLPSTSEGNGLQVVSLASTAPVTRRTTWQITHNGEEETPSQLPEERDAEEISTDEE